MKEKIGNEIREEFESLYHNKSIFKKVVEDRINQVEGYVKFTNGKIFAFMRQKIVKDFYLNAKDFSCKEKIFFKENMKYFSKLEEIIKSKSYSYSWNPVSQNCNLVHLVSHEYLKVYSYKSEDFQELTLLDKILLQRELEIQKNEMMKRLEKYWKKYNSKLNFKINY